MGFADAATGHAHLHLDEAVTIRTYSTGFSVRRRRETPDRRYLESEWTSWARRQGGGVAIESPTAIGEDFSAVLAEGLVVRWDDRLTGRAPNSISVQTDGGEETVVSRIREAGRRRYLVLQT